MPKGKLNKRYTGEFKQMVIETMHREKLSFKEEERQFEITSHSCVQSRERIYLTEVHEGLYEERRERGSKGLDPTKAQSEKSHRICWSATPIRAGSIRNYSKTTAFARA